MIMRICSVCNTKWYSSERKGDWTCETCGAVMYEEDNQSTEEIEE